MSSNAQKTALQRSLSDFGKNRVATGAQLLGKTLPCSVIERVSSKIVRVKFEIQDNVITLPPVTMPIFGTEFIREPILPGCKGEAIAADAYLGAISGLGSGIATLARQPNLSCLMFMPLGNTGFTEFDHNALVLYGGTAGTVIMDSVNNNTSITITATAITIKVGSKTMVIDGTGITIEGREFLTHEHTGVQAGGSNTGPVV